MPRESDLRLDQLRRIGELGVSRDQRGCGRVVLLAPLVVSQFLEDFSLVSCGLKIKELLK